MSAHIFQPVIAKCLNGIVEREHKGWPVENPITLKFLTLEGQRLFNRAGEFIKNDERFRLRSIPDGCIAEASDVRVVEMLESAIIDVVLNLPVLDKSSNLWSLGWDRDFKWGNTMPSRCAFDFMECFATVIFSIIDSSTGEYRSFHHSWVCLF